MLNRIIKFSLDQRLTVLVLSAVVLVAGIAALMRTEVDIFPDLNAPTVVVMTEAKGMAPEEVEQLVTYPIETTVNGGTGVRRVRSTSSTGFSTVVVEFDWGVDIYHARQTVSERLQEMSGTLPPGVGTPIIGPQSSILGEMMIIGLTADTTSMTDLRTLADRIIAPRLTALQGVSKVNVIGGDIKEYQVLADPGLMKHYGVTLESLEAALENSNINASGGIINDFGQEYLVKGNISTTDTEELSLIPVETSDGNTVTIGHIATVQTGAKEPVLGTASERCKPAVLLTVNKQPGSGTIELTERIETELAALVPSLPADVHVSTDIFRQSTFIDASITNLQESLLEGMLFVIIVLFFFLMNLRTTLISVVALPMSIIVSVLVLHWMGFTINTMSIGGIAIAIGSLVDDAIVDVENVYKRLRENRELPATDRKPTITVVFEASKEVRMPIFNSSLIIIASFLPLFFLSGIEGRMLIPLGVSFIVALIASTIVALTLTPVLCSYLLGGSESEEKALGKEPALTRMLKERYRRSLEWAMSHTRIVLGTTACLFVLAAIVLMSLGRGFLPAFNEGSFTVNVSAMPGVSLEESDRIGRLAEELILEVPEVRTVARKTGRAELDEHALGSNVSELEAPYVLDKGRTRGAVARELRSKLATIPGANIEIGQPISHRIDAMLSGTEAQIAVKVFGPDLQTLYSIGRKIKETMGEVGGIVDVNLEQQIGRPQIDIKPRRGMMARYEVTPGQLSDFIETAMGGNVLSQVYDNGLPYDLTLKFTPESRTSIEALRDLPVDTRKGKIPLSAIAEVISTSAPNTINRENVARRLVISGNVEGRDLRGAVNELIDQVATKVEMPEGYYVTYGGQFESEQRASRTLMLTSIIALALIFMLLYQEFKSLREAAVIMVNMPLALIGGALILWITGNELNIPAVIGFISLIGISTRNGMLLMSRYNHLSADGVALGQRIVKGSVDRMTPILMTALTSALALVPIALRSGEAGNEIQSPLAIVILGGLISSTFLNVYIVPILYRFIETKKNRS
ncbi:MAG: CusA/CzcA family heavy metal efflux RND transporter [Muribaculaceae bacterium]|nr:CusA/CzcA family heavy metal efflux RND transporter [Muribaculaceae bacterium]